MTNSKNMHLTIRRRVWGISNKWRISGFCGYGNSVGIPTVFVSVGMGWIWELKFNSHGSPAENAHYDGSVLTSITFSFVDQSSKTFLSPTWEGS